MRSAVAISLMTFLLTASVVCGAKDAFPERKLLEGKAYVIEYSAGDEPYAAALAKQLPLDPAAVPAPATLPLTLAELRSKRAQVLALVGAQLALPPTTARIGQTFDAFVTSYSMLQSLHVAPPATRFALWRKPELEARLNARQEVAGFSRNAAGEVEFSMGANFELREGEAPEMAVTRMREDWSRLTWPIKIGEDPAQAPDAEISERLAGVREMAAQLGAFQSAEMQRLAVVTVLHETVEATLVDAYLRSVDRRWFCEGVANFVAYRVLENLIGAEQARAYSDVDAEVAKYAALETRVDLRHWPVVEDAASRRVPADVNAASYAFATRAIFTAFGGPPDDLLARVLSEVGKTPREQADIKTVFAAYRLVAGRELRVAGLE